jgi:hypothetical protein
VQQKTRQVNWANMLGYRGHFAVNPAATPPPSGALRQARADYRRRQHPAPISAEPGGQGQRP